MATLELIPTLQQLIRIPSVNPMGRSVAGAPYGEHALTDFLEQSFRALGLPCCRQTVAPGRENIIARLDAPYDADRRSVILFEAHQDTVPADGMTIDPWEPRIEQGRVFGRGACDVKGAMACMLAALAQLSDTRPPEMPTLLMACTVNEEHGFTGAQRLAQSWQDGSLPLLDRAPDQVIVAEPTDLQVVVTHKGLVRWRCHAAGRAAHSACPDRGENAIYHMARTVLELERLAHALQRAPGDPRLGPPTLNVGTIHGGICVNAVPDQCTIEIDRRVLPDETPEAARQQALDWLAQHLPDADRVRHEPPFLISAGLSDRENRQLATRLQQMIQARGGTAHQVGVPYGTNAPFYAAAGAPTVVFGPGSIAQAHTADEWISIDQLHAATDLFTAVGRGATLDG